MNVCFTAAGLAAFGLPDEVLCTFPPEFREGMTTPARSRVLGDTIAAETAAYQDAWCGQADLDS